MIRFDGQQVVTPHGVYTAKHGFISVHEMSKEEFPFYLECVLENLIEKRKKLQARAQANKKVSDYG